MNDTATQDTRDKLAREMYGPKCTFLSCPKEEELRAQLAEALEQPEGQAAHDGEIISDLKAQLAEKDKQLATIERDTVGKCFKVVQSYKNRLKLDDWLPEDPSYTADYIAEGINALLRDEKEKG
jgi:hypothetical protein